MGRSVREAFVRVPDPRTPRGRRQLLPAMLARSTAALRNTASTMLRPRGAATSADSLRALGWQSGARLRLLGWMS